MYSWPSASEPTLLSRRARFGQGELSSQENGYIYFGIIGLETELESVKYGTNELGYFERLSQPPSSTSIRHAIADDELANALLRYAPDVKFQLAIKADLGEAESTALALRVISALRVKTRVDLLVPAFLSVSWNDLEKVILGTCAGRILEDIPSARLIEEPRDILRADFEWIWEYGDAFAELLTIPRFSIAVEALCYCHLIRDPRMMAANLWAGIEALCEVEAELRFRIALIAASVIESRGKRRLALFKRIQKLYDVRSKAVHGVDVAAADLSRHVIEVRILLAQLITRCVEANRVFVKDDFDNMLLC